MEIIGEEKQSQEVCKCGELLYSTLVDFGEDSIPDGLYLIWQCKKCGYTHYESL